MLSYEEIYRQAINLDPAPSFEDRDVVWLSPYNSVGLARTHEGRVELFFTGSELHPRSRVVRQCIEYHTWHRTDGESVAANRILLPGAGHFDQVAAFISTEMLRNGADADTEEAFTRSEPIIELAIERLRLSDEAVLGLAGELLLLDGLLNAVPDDHVTVVLSSWFGWRESRRDFELGPVGIEVKTTTRSVSAHRVQGVHQVELNPEVEDALYLVSVGAEWVSSDHSNARSIPELVDSALERIQTALPFGEQESAVETFLVRLGEYGADLDARYDHRTMASNPTYGRSFITLFCRGYDMTDPNVDVLRSNDVLRRTHVEYGSVSFAVNLPERVTGDVNPAVGMSSVVERIVDTAGLT